MDQSSGTVADSSFLFDHVDVGSSHREPNGYLCWHRSQLPLRVAGACMETTNIIGHKPGREMRLKRKVILIPGFKNKNKKKHLGQRQLRIYTFPKSTILLSHICGRHLLQKSRLWNVSLPDNMIFCFLMLLHWNWKHMRTQP